MRPIVLQLSFSHYCHKATWALSHAGIAYDVLNTLPHHMVRFQQVASGTVPVMRVGDDIVDGSHAILEWAEAHNQGDPLYPEGHRDQVMEWEAWADEVIGPIARRQAYRVLYQTPRAYQGGALTYVVAKLGKRPILQIMKYYKSRRFDGTDPQASKDIIQRIADATQDGWLVGPHRTAADIAVAALVQPLLRAWPGLGLGMAQEAAAVQAFVERVKPPLKQIGRKRARRSDFAAWAELGRGKEEATTV